MIEFMNRTDGRNVGVHVKGEVGAKDFRALADLLREQIEAQQKIRLVLHLESVGLVPPAVLWEELQLAFEHLDDVERIALVGDDLWQEAFVKVFGPLSPADMRHFHADDLDDAWRWIH